MSDSNLEANFRKSGESDNEIWKKFKSGDIKSYEVIYRSNVQHMFNYGMSIIRNEGLVKDCIQELFLDLWKSRRNLSSTGNIKYYLLKALRWKINHSKVRDKKMVAMDKEPQVFSKHISFPFEDELIRSQHVASRKLKVEHALDKLTSRQKEVITLIFYEGFTYEEVASIMSISIGSVYTLAWKAITQIKRLV